LDLLERDHLTLDLLGSVLRRRMCAVWIHVPSFFSFVCERWIIEAYFVGSDENIGVIPVFF
jgi:hypothetical protein